jgi:isoamylase
MTLNATLQIQRGNPSFLGATIQADGVNFAVFSEHATAVQVCLFDSSGQQFQGCFELQKTAGSIWQALVANLDPTWTYAYRVGGPYQPEHGHWFDSNKLLLDPYAQELTGPLSLSPAHESRAHHNTQDCTPKCRFQTPLETRCSTRIGPYKTLSERIIYELHVRGFSKLNEALPEPLRGTYAGLAHSASIDYLHSLGVDTIELMPLALSVDEPFLVERGLTNYWAYNPVSLFAVNSRYAMNPDQAVAELKDAITALHQAGIDVIVDVVLNHTGEGGADGSTFCWKGLDNASYYHLSSEQNAVYANHSGCGNAFNLSHPRVLQLMADALRYWVTAFGVDGFRFDLAATLGRNQRAFDQAHPFFSLLQQDPILKHTILIAEPWDVGPEGYQLGAFPAPLSEWNDQFRDSVRRFWRGDSGVLADFAKALHGSAEIFERSGRDASASVNFVTSHDGFTAWDAVSYRDRHNEANQEDNRDGHSHNFSLNYGVEGETPDTQINAKRAQHVKNLVGTTLIAQGVPMLLAGDERLNTQGGNNNAYCQDNATTWLCWREDPFRERIFAWVAQAISVRRDLPPLHQSDYHHENWTWHRLDGSELTPIHWRVGDLEGLQCRIYGKQPEHDICVCFNRSWNTHSIHLPVGDSWYLWLDSSESAGAESRDQISSFSFQIWARRPCPSAIS